MLSVRYPCSSYTSSKKRLKEIEKGGEAFREKTSDSGRVGSRRTLARTMAPDDALDARLRRRWTKRGGGPDLERRLAAAEAELARRANVETAERRGVRVLETSRVPVSDPTTGLTPRVSSRPSMGTAEDSTAAPSLPLTPPRVPIRVDDALAEARALTRSQTRRAAASDPRNVPPGRMRGLDAKNENDESDDETQALEAGSVVVANAFVSLSSGPISIARDSTVEPRFAEPTRALERDAALRPFLELKRAANGALTREGDVQLATALYDEALERLEAFRDTEQTRVNATLNANARDAMAVFLSNRAYCKTLLSPPDAPGAARDAEKAIATRADWHRPYDRAAEAHAMLGNWKRAVAFCREGERVAREAVAGTKDDARAKARDAATAFATRLDRLAMRAAREGSLAGFYGRLIYVRSAGEEAWLCREAPANPAWDDDERGDDVASRVRARRGEVERFQSVPSEPVRAAAPAHARSLREALDKAEDGDRILLLRGTHNGCGDSVTVTKRVLITGEGALRDAVVDARNNSPIFRLRRACWIANVDFDFTGFSEALRVESGDGAAARAPDPLVERCGIKCSGSDGVVVAAEAAPTFRDCSFEAKKTGLRACGAARVELVDCKFAGCERQGLRCTESAAATATHCVFAENGHEGLVAAGSSVVECRDCVLRDNGGPGADVSGVARLALARCAVEKNVGGVFAWDESEAEMRETMCEGGKSHALLVDENASCACFEKTRVKGVVHASDATRARVAPGRDGSCVVEHPAAPTDLPPETGCFKFEHDQYLRKQ